MTLDQILQLAAQGGIGLLALAILGKIGLKVADRMILAIDALAKEARDTGKATVDALGQLTERLSRLEGKVEILASEWPGEETSERTERRGRARSPAPDIEDYPPRTRR